MALAPRDIDGWPKWKMTRNGFTGERKIKTEWSNVDGLARTLIDAEDGFGHLWPYAPTTSRAHAIGVSVEGFGKSGQHPDDQKLITYDHAIVTVQYRTPQGGDERPGGGGSSGEPEGGFIERFLPSADNEPLNHEDFVWETPGAGGLAVALKADQAPTHPVVGMDYLLTRTRLRSLPTTVFSLSGHVNEDDFRLFTFDWNFGPESLLYNAPEIDHTINPSDGASMFDVTYRLSIKQVRLADGTLVGGWNYAFRPDLQGWDRIALKKEDGGIGAVHKNLPLAVFGRL